MSKQGLFNYGQDIVMAFSPPVVGCLVKKDLQKGGGVTGTPGPPPAYALVCRLSGLDGESVFRVKRPTFF